MSSPPCFSSEKGERPVEYNMKGNEFQTMSELLHSQMSFYVLYHNMLAFYASPDLAALAPVYSRLSGESYPKTWFEAKERIERHIKAVDPERRSLIARYDAICKVCQEILVNLQKVREDQRSFDDFSPKAREAILALGANIEVPKDIPDGQRVSFVARELLSTLERSSRKGKGGSLYTVGGVALKNALAMALDKRPVDLSELEFETLRVEIIRNNATDLLDTIRNAISFGPELAKGYQEELNSVEEAQSKDRRTTFEEALSHMAPFGSLFVEMGIHSRKLEESRESIKLGVSEIDFYQGFLPPYHPSRTLPLFCSKPAESKNQTMYMLAKALGKPCETINLPNTDKSSFGLTMYDAASNSLKNRPVESYENLAKKAGFIILDEVLRPNEEGLGFANSLHSLNEGRLKDLRINEGAYVIMLSNRGQDMIDGALEIDSAMLSRIAPFTLNEDAAAFRYKKYIQNTFGSLIPPDSELQSFLSFLFTPGEAGGFDLLCKMKEKAGSRGSVMGNVECKDADKRNVTDAISPLLMLNDNPTLGEIKSHISTQCGPALAGRFDIFSRTVEKVPSLSEMLGALNDLLDKGKLNLFEATAAFDANLSIEAEGLVSHGLHDNTLALINGLSYIKDEKEREKAMAPYRESGVTPLTEAAKNERTDKLKSMGPHTHDKVFIEAANAIFCKKKGKINYLEDLAVRNIIADKIKSGFIGYMQAFSANAEYQRKAEESKAKREGRDPNPVALDGRHLIDMFTLCALYPDENCKMNMVREIFNYIFLSPSKETEKLLTDYGIAYGGDSSPLSIKKLTPISDLVRARASGYSEEVVKKAVEIAEHLEKEERRNTVILALSSQAPQTFDSNEKAKEMRELARQVKVAADTERYEIFIGFGVAKSLSNRWRSNFTWDMEVESDFSGRA